MTTETTLSKHQHHHAGEMHQGGGSGAVYGLGLIGAWVYYFQCATTFQEYALAFFKGLVWPAFLVYDLLVFLKKINAPPESRLNPLALNYRVILS